MRAPNYKTWVIGLCALAFLAPCARAQDQPADNPNQPGSDPCLSLAAWRVRRTMANPTKIRRISRRIPIPFRERNF